MQNAARNPHTQVLAPHKCGPDTLEGAPLKGRFALSSGDATQAAQLFVNDYTLVRNTLVDFDSKAVWLGRIRAGWEVHCRKNHKSCCMLLTRNKPLAGDKSGAVFVGKTGDWAKWTYFPRLGLQ